MSNKLHKKYCRFCFRQFFMRIIILFVPVAAQAQIVTLHHPEIQYLFEDSLVEQSYYHSALKPIEITWKTYDSVMHIRNTFNLYKGYKPLRILPVIDASTSFEKEGNQWLYQFGQGIYTSGMLGKKAGFEFSAVLSEQKFNTAYSGMLDSLKLVPGYNRYLWSNGTQAGYLSIRGFIYWKPIKWLTLKAGNDKNFIGDGFRSLLLSENAAAYPFFQTQLKIWKINYTQQVMVMRDLIYGFNSQRFTKYASQHTLSLNVDKRLSLYIFETVIWRKQDSLRHRGFDITYLNPFLFFRPIEYNQGSPDNVLMGLGGKYRVGGKNFLYAQLLLDEFNIKEVRANNGWWANKYGYQLGIKCYGIFHSVPSLFQLEYNHVRPFTYSHTSSLQNYGYLTRSLAHPQGSNFREIICIIRAEVSPKYSIHTRFSFTQYGSDPAGLNYGSDIYKNQWTYTKFTGNYTTQGVLNNITSGEIMVSRVIMPAWRLNAFILTDLTIQKTEGKTTFVPVIQLGIHTLLYE
jgi:hypothetical protein